MINFGGFVLVVMMLTLIALSVWIVILIFRLERTRRERDMALDLAEQAAHRAGRWQNDHHVISAEWGALWRVAIGMQKTLQSLHSGEWAMVLEAIEPWTRISLDDLVVEELAKEVDN